MHGQIGLFLILVSSTFAAYWFSIALSQKDGPFDILVLIRSAFPVLKMAWMIGDVLAVGFIVLASYVPLAWAFIAPFGFAGAILFGLSMIGIQDYETV